MNNEFIKADSGSIGMDTTIRLILPPEVKTSNSQNDMKTTTTTTENQAPSDRQKVIDRVLNYSEPATLINFANLSVCVYHEMIPVPHVSSFQWKEELIEGMEVLKTLTFSVLNTLESPHIPIRPPDLFQRLFLVYTLTDNRGEIMVDDQGDPVVMVKVFSGFQIHTIDSSDYVLGYTGDENAKLAPRSITYYCTYVDQEDWEELS